MQINGLSEQEAKKRFNIYGENKIERKKKISPLEMLISQFKSPIIILLVAAAVISMLVNSMKGEAFIDSILILVIVFAAAIAGFIQDYKAERTIEALKRMAAPTAKVIRDGKEKEIDSSLIVPGDIIVLSGGDIVPADAIIVQGKLELDESMLTGESRSVKRKKGDKIFSGCPVYSGNAIAKVYATGMNTEMGKLAARMEEMEEEETPFEAKMRSFTKKIVIMTIIIIIITFAIGLNKFGLIEAFLIAVSLAVAAIPEDLPAIITIALSLGARDMASQNALVRRLAVTESIGSVDVICTDKTGTLTLGEMKVSDLWFIGKSEVAKELAVKACYFCNDAKIIVKENEERWVGDETDIALKEFSLDKVKENGKRVDEIPFNSERKMMAVAYRINKEMFVFAKGAPEVIVEKCTKAIVNGKIVKMTKKIKEGILEENGKYAFKGNRVLALAYKKGKGKLDKELIFIGLVILSDPPRPEVRRAIQDCYSAGIRVIMITGDNPKTALAIADKVGIETDGVVVGKELDAMTDDELEKALASVNVFARTNPFHKTRILEILQKSGHVVAMTGDGVNDSLALKKADVGIAMGKKGTEVAKEASDIILLDDNFATIRNAVKEGRRIFDNIRKFVDYLLTCNVAEVLVVLSATAWLPFISLYPAQILWINLITDGLPALALAVDPPRPDVMKRKPRKKGEGIINKRLAMLIGSIGLEKSLVILGSFLVVLPLGEARARTVLFTAFILYEFVRIAVIRFNEKLSSLKDWMANKFLVASLIASLLLQIALIYTPIGSYFKVVPLGLYEWEVLITGTLIGFVLGIGIAWVIDKITGEEY